MKTQLKKKKSTITTSAAVYLILQRANGDILMMRRCNTGYQDGMYQTVAGHLEMNELPTDALIRESWEEVRIKIARRDVKLVHVSARPAYDKTGNRSDLFFLVTRWKGVPVIGEKKKCDDLRWVSPRKLPKNTTPHVREGLRLAFKGIVYSEFTEAWVRAQPEYGLK